VIKNATVSRQGNAWWTAPCEWPGKTAFVVGGGPSVLSQPIELLRGRNVIVINSSYETIPFADYLVTFDPKWWTEHKKKLLEFKGRIVAPSKVQLFCRLRHFMKRVDPPGLAAAPDSLAMMKTTFTAGINLAAHLVGSGGRIVLLGADGQKDKDGRSHHHPPHSWWTFNSRRWGLHHEEMASLVAPLRDRGIDVVNASPGSAWADLWPVMSLAQAIELTTARRAA